MTDIYLVRHAQSEGNAIRRFQGRTDVPLSAMGLEQAKLVGKRFADIPLDAIYASPLSRARQTAEAIVAHHELSVVVEPEIIEIDGGGFENMYFDEIALHYPGELEKFDKHPHLFTGLDGGESVLDVYARMVRAVGEIAARHPNQTVAVVSHGCAIRCYLCFAKAFPLERLEIMGETDWGLNTCVSHVVYDGDTVSLRFVNDASHLDALPENGKVWR